MGVQELLGAIVVSRAIEDVTVLVGVVVAAVVRMSVDLEVLADMEDVMIIEVVDVVFSTHSKKYQYMIFVDVWLIQG